MSAPRKVGTGFRIRRANSQAGAPQSTETGFRIRRANSQAGAPQSTETGFRSRRANSQAGTSQSTETGFRSRRANSQAGAPQSTETGFRSGSDGADGDGPPFAVDVRGLTKRFGHKVAVNNIDIAIPTGEVWGFLGPNGSGKTTTIRMLCGLLEADEGEGTCLGYDFRQQSEQIKRETGYMTQKFSFWEDLSIRENLDFVARLYRLPDRRKLVEATLEDLGLFHRRHQMAGELSGGWKQRLALAACMLHAPKLLLLDEPTAGVDPKARRDFWDQIHQLSGRGITVLVSTHYMDEAERCDRIVYINVGHLIAKGTVAEIIENSGLITFTVAGDGARKLAEKLRGAPGVEFVAFFGAKLHVSGYDRSLLEAALASFAGDSDLIIGEAATSLEDVFIQLQQNRRGDTP
jgi:ABC-2 type transport system ATP-binding protein